MIDVTFDTDELQRKLDSLAGTLTGAQMARAIALGINKTLKQARTQSDREIRRVYNIRQTFVLRYIKLKNASNSNFTGQVFFPTKPVPMGEFLKTKGGKRVKFKRKATPISVEIIKGHRQTLHGAFLLQSKYAAAGGRVSIMHRSNVTGNSSYNGNFQFRHKRVQSTGRDLPIGAMFSSSPLSSVFNPIVKGNIKKYSETKLMDNIFTTLDKMVAGHIRSSNRRGGRYKP